MATKRSDLYRTGNSQRPAAVRVGMDIETDLSGNIHPTSPPTGLSVFAGVEQVPTKGWVWHLSTDDELPEGLVAISDPPPAGHFVIGVARSMPLAGYLSLLDQLPWRSTGIKRK